MDYYEKHNNRWKENTNHHHCYNLHHSPGSLCFIKRNQWNTTHISCWNSCSSWWINSTHAKNIKELIKIANKNKPEEFKDTDKTKTKPEKPAEEVEEKSTALIDKANEAAERMERANTKKEELLEREEALKVESTLGGEAEAGAAAETEDEKITREAKEMMGEIGIELEPEEKNGKPRDSVQES